MNFINIIEHFAAQLGYFGIFILSMFLPTEIVVPFVGISISKGIYNFKMALLITFLGEIAASIFNYSIGHWFGEKFITKLKNKSEKNKRTIEKIERMSKEYGEYAILIARLIPFARTYVSILAGANNIEKKSFIKYTIMGILMANIALLFFGYYIGINGKLIWNFIHKYAISLIGIICFIIIIARVRRKRKKSKN